ncbi:sensor histidine kinase [Paenibacillus sp. strain BS8-2]
MVRKWRITTILRMFFILVVFLPILLICFFVLNMYKQDLIEQNTMRSLQTTEAIAYSVQQEINRMAGLFASIGVDPEVQSVASDIHLSSGIAKQSANNKLKTIIEKYTSTVSGRLLSINFFYSERDSYSYQRNMVEDDHSVRQQSWYNETLEQPNRVQFLGMLPNLIYGNYNSYMMASAIAVSDYNALNEIELILFTFNSDAFDNILLSRDNQTSEISIVDQSGKLVATNTLVERGSMIPEDWMNRFGNSNKGSFVDSNGEKSLVTYSNVFNSDWKIVQRIPYDDLIMKYKQAFAIIIVIGAVIGIAFLLLSFYFVSNISKYLRELLRVMNRVSGGDLDVRINAQGSMEMMKIGNTFNQMTDQVKVLIEQKEANEKDKRKAEFAALQSQINPHFLINTLNSIKFMALISKADNIRNMTHALTRLLSSSFNRGGMHTTVSDEIDHLRHYLYIMEIRYGLQFTTVWNIESSVTECSLLKLLLQPIIENSVTHGLKNINYPGAIEITAREEGNDLIFEISDNGKGISENMMHQISTGITQDTFSGMGIVNVHNRIQLHYGIRYGLRFESNTPHGTKVFVRLPIIIQPADDAEAS